MNEPITVRMSSKKKPMPAKQKLTLPASGRGALPKRETTSPTSEEKVGSVSLPPRNEDMERFIAQISKEVAT